MLCSFFKDSLNKRAETPTLKLYGGIVSTFAKFEYERSSSKTERVFEKNEHDFPFFLKKGRQPFGLEVNFMLKCDLP